MPQKLYTQEEYNEKLNEFWNNLKKYGDDVLSIRDGLSSPVPMECCPICMDDFNITDMVKCPDNNHYIGCKSCVKEFKKTHNFDSYGEYQKIKCPCCRTKLWESKEYYETYKFKKEQQYSIIIEAEKQERKGCPWLAFDRKESYVKVEDIYQRNGKDKVKLKMGRELCLFTNFKVPQYITKDLPPIQTINQRGESGSITLRTLWYFNEEKTIRYKAVLFLGKSNCKRKVVNVDVLRV